jgi:hypothetical protein
MKYFSDIELGEKERVSEEITEDIHKGIVAVYRTYATKNAFSESAAFDCPDGYPGVCGFNEKLFFDLAKGKIPNFDLKKYNDKYMILGFVQFCYSHVKKANKSVDIPYIDGLTGNETYTSSYTFDESKSEKENFKNTINTIFRRNGLVFELQEDGEIIRKIPKGIEPLVSKLYETDDAELNKLINEAFDNFLKVKIEDRIVAVEKIWDAFERMKTYYQEKNKKNSIEALIKEVSSGNDVMIEILDAEAVKLTDIGNGKREDKSNTGLSIRHHETNKVNIDSNEHIDILFYRMVSYMQLFLKHLEIK